MTLTEKQEKEAYKDWLFGDTPRVVCKRYEISYPRLFDIIEKWNRVYEEQLQTSNSNNTNIYARVVYPVYTSSSSMHYRTEDVDIYHFKKLLNLYGERLEIISKR